jgi:hypothetical protein
MAAMADGHQPNHALLAINSVYNPKPANTIFPQAVEFAQERLLPTLRAVAMLRTAARMVYNI